ncbi:hypothetical protein CWT12_01980 [Actinomyces sp. 432]|uniref:endonuclease domain-containing protein n=1 Tax=Actinomyces sp. 432 TaxID=2057798 RepID=UPI0013740DAC|nr:hypothetical protein [Actinomyces sp. 432]QHO90354.1 hypothetical protein CWT12_01980 [Actinomyces sp. 432]
MDTIPAPPPLPTIEFTYAGRPSRSRAGDTRVQIAPGVALLPTPGRAVWAQQREVGLARCVAAVHSARSAVVLTHEAAALVHGLWLRHGETDIRIAVPTNPKRTRLPLAPVAFTDGNLPHPSGAGRAISLRRRRSRLQADDVEVVNGLPVTSLLRTAVDCAFDLPARESITIVDSAMRALCQPDRFSPQQAKAKWERVRPQLLAAVGAEGPRRGAVRARAVAAMASPFSESPGESLTRRLVVALGLPGPELQHEIMLDADGHRFLDFAWPDLRLAIEFDGRSKYSLNDDLWEEKLRQDAIGAMGWSFIRVTYADLNDEERLTARIMERMPPSVTLRARRVPGLWE